MSELRVVAGQHDDGSPSWLVLTPDDRCVANLTRRDDAEHVAATWRPNMSNRLSTAAVARMARVTPRTIASYAARGQMPPPSRCECCGHTPTWLRQDIAYWLTTRPGRGVGGGRPRKGDQR